MDDSRVVEALKLSSERIALLNSVPKSWEGEEISYHYSPEQMQKKVTLEFRIASLLSAAEQAA
jgi:hypothetical protein